MDPAWWILAGYVVVTAVGFYGYHRRTSAVVNTVRHDAADRVSRMKADSENRVSRIERESAKTQERSEHRFARDLLPVMDAMDQAEMLGNSDAEALHDGLVMVHRQFERVLEGHGVTRILPSAGDVFDPRLHEAVDLQSSDEVESGCIVICHRAGYLQGDDVLRAAMVVVSE